MHIKNKKGQSTVEYVLLMTAVVAVIIGFVATNNTGGFQDQMNKNLNSAVSDIGSMTDKLTASHNPPASSTTDNNVGDGYTVNVAN